MAYSSSFRIILDKSYELLLDSAKQPHAEGDSMRSAGVDGGAWADFGPWPTIEGFLVVSDGGSCAAVWRDGMARWRGGGIH